MQFLYQIIYCVLGVMIHCGLQAQIVPSLENKTVNGYKGIWYSLGQFSEYGDKYSGGLGTYTAKHIPLAIYAPQVDKTFFVYGGTTSPYDQYLLCMAGSYDHKSNVLSKPVIVFDKKGVEDPHDNPSLTIDSKGYLWVFVSGRGKSRLGAKYRSIEPYSVAGFEMITEEEMTYPQPKYIPEKGFLHLFTKYTGQRELYFEISEDGSKWTPDKHLVGMKRQGDTHSGHYQISGQKGNKIGFFFNWHPNGNVDLRTNIYYMETNDMGETWTTIDGKPLAIPVTDVSSNCLVKEFFSNGENVYIKDLNYDENGYPVGLYLSGKGHQPGPNNGPRQWAIVYWNGKSWIHRALTTSDHNYDTGSMFLNGDEWTVIIPSENRPQEWGAGGELVMWKSDDKGKTWNRIKQLTDRSQRNHNYVRKVVNGKDPFLYFWADGNPNHMSESLLYFGSSKGHIWQMPYEMMGEAQIPVRVK